MAYGGYSLGQVPRTSVSGNMLGPDRTTQAFELGSQAIGLLGALVKHSKARGEERYNSGIQVAKAYLTDHDKSLDSIMQKDPDNPLIPQLREKIRSYQDQINQIDLSETNPRRKYEALRPVLQNLGQLQSDLDSPLDQIRQQEGQLLQEKRTVEQEKLRREPYVQSAQAARTFVPKSNTGLRQRIATSEMGIAQPEDNAAALLNTIGTGGAGAIPRARTAIEMTQGLSADVISPHRSNEVSVTKDKAYQAAIDSGLKENEFKLLKNPKTGDFVYKVKPTVFNSGFANSVSDLIKGNNLPEDGSLDSYKEFVQSLFGKQPKDIKNMSFEEKKVKIDRVLKSLKIYGKPSPSWYAKVISSLTKEGSENSSIEAAAQ